MRPLLDDPAAGMDGLVAVMRAYWERAIEPWWPAIRAVLEADVVHRARRLAGGTIEVFADLHRGVRWRDGAVEVERFATRTSTCAAAGCCSCRRYSRGRRSSRWSTSRGSRR